MTTASVASALPDFLSKTYQATRKAQQAAPGSTTDRKAHEAQQQAASQRTADGQSYQEFEAEQLYQQLDDIAATRREVGRERSDNAATVRRWCNSQKRIAQARLRALGYPTRRPGNGWHWIGQPPTWQDKPATSWQADAEQALADANDEADTIADALHAGVPA